MWKKIVLSLLIIISGVAGFFVAKAQVTFNNTLNHVNRDYDTALKNVDLSGIKVNSGETPGLEGAEFTIKLNRNVEEAYSKGYTYEEVWNGIDENGNKVKVDYA